MPRSAFNRVEGQAGREKGKSKDAPGRLWPLSVLACPLLSSSNQLELTHGSQVSLVP